MTDSYDVIVIGAGPAGENAAAYAIAGSDRTAVVIEQELVGGECSYWACMPSKALLRPGHLLGAARAMPGVRELVGDRGLDVDAVLGRRDSFTHNHDDSSQVKWANDTGIEVVRGLGTLTGERTVEVDGRTLTARHAVVLATGSSANIPGTPGLREAAPWTSRDVTNLREVPRRVLVIGGGVVACESATWLRSLGAEVVMVVRGNSLLAAAEPFAGERVATALQAIGVRILFGANLSEVSRSDPADTGEGAVHGGPITAVVDGEQITVDEIVVAAGRAPRTEGLGLDNVGVSADEHGSVRTDDRCNVEGAGDWLYAVGDVNGRAPLTHMGKYQARVCGDVIAARAQGNQPDGPRFTAGSDHGRIPQVVFTDPEVAWVGRTEKQARDEGFDVSTTEIDIAVAGSSLARDDYDGRAKIVVDTSDDTLLGVTFVGPDVGELLHAATIAVVGKVPLDTLWHAVPSYPTVSEVWLRLLEERRSS